MMKDGAITAGGEERLRQAREFLEEARALLDAGMDLKFVANNVYHAMMSAVRALLEQRGLQAGTQSIAIGLFDKEFVDRGVMERDHSEALHQAFEFRPSCECEEPKALTKGDLEGLLPKAERFLGEAERILR